MDASTPRADETGNRPTAAILVVDDDARVRQLIQWELEDEGFSVVTAANGGEALALAATHRPSAVVLDLSLPVHDGPSVAEALRRMHGPDLPIVVISADGRVEEKAARVGANAAFAKPFQPDELVAAVRRAVEPV